MSPSSLFRRNRSIRLFGKRVLLRPLQVEDFDMWREIRVRNETWLVPWEPRRSPNAADPVYDRSAFESRCTMRERDRQSDSSYPFGVFLGEQLIGELNINNVTRGALQNGTIGYWIDRAHAGNSYIAESVVVGLKYAFEQLHLHRMEICIVPRNHNSRRVMDKIGMRDEGVALRYLEINGVWEDHVRYAITVEEWRVRQDELAAAWLVT